MRDILDKQKKTVRRFMLKNLSGLLSSVIVGIIVGVLALFLDDKDTARRLCYVALPNCILFTVFSVFSVKAFVVFRAVYTVALRSTERCEISCDKVRFMTYLRGTYAHSMRSAMIGVIFVDTEGQRFYYVFPENHWLANTPETRASYEQMRGRIIRLQCYRESHVVKRVDK